MVADVNRLLTTPGKTYQDIVDFIREQGYSISHSSIGRYGKDFLSKLEDIRRVRDQAAAIVDEIGDKPATEMAEAANQIAVQLIMETLMEVDSLKDEKLTEVLVALSRLERSGIAREKLKMDYQKRITETAKSVTDKLVKKKIDPEVISMIETEILGLNR